ncbi:MAG: PD40 domain-containing protein [Lentisphaeria bacterium]|nr:PD40 domain-containing protein [Lentisphaeria bacterium]
MKKIFLFACLFSFSVILFAQVDVAVTGKKGNDTLLFRGFQGSEDMRRQVEKDLRNCGWFDVQRGGVTTFIISGRSSGTSLELTLSDGAGVKIASIRVYGNTIPEASHKAVDGVLKHLYRVEGLCDTRIAFTAQISPMQKEIYTCDYDGSNFRRETRNRGLSLDPVWSPRGNTIVYSYIGNAFTTLMEYNIQNGQSRQLAKFNGLNAGGAISPDGSKIALVLSKDNQVDLYVRATNGGPLKRLTRDKAVEASPCWSPDGTKICYVSDSGYGRPRLHVISANGGRGTRLPGTLGSESVSPSWSRDGKIAYAGKMGNYTICVADPSGVAEQEPRQKVGVVVNAGGDWESPSWAPDNRHVVCSHNGGLYVVDTWTGKTRQIVGGRSKCTLPDWSR